MIPDNWPPPAARKEVMKASTAIFGMVLVTIALLCTGMWALSQEWGGAGWVLIIGGTISAMSTLGSLARIAK